MQKNAGQSGVASAQYCCRSAAREEINDREKHDRRERADNKHIAHILPGDGGARLGRAFNDVVVFHPRHMDRSLDGNAPSFRKQRRGTRRCSARLERLKGANMERAQSLTEQRHAVKEYFPIATSMAAMPSSFIIAVTCRPSFLVPCAHRGHREMSC